MKTKTIVHLLEGRDTNSKFTLCGHPTNNRVITVAYNRVTCKTCLKILGKE